MKTKSLVKGSIKEQVKLESLQKFAIIPKHLKKPGLLPSDFKAAVVNDKKGFPKYFIFDTYSLWDLLCAIDTKYEEQASNKEYVFNNPVGWLIDAIEAKLPINPKLAIKLKKGIEEAKKMGFIPFEKLTDELNLS